MYSTINNSVTFYQLNGYKYIDTPWLVDEAVSNITKPADRQNFNVKNKVLVASGEQSFLQLITDKTFLPGKYCTVTPCFRDEDRETKFHKYYFLKTELIYWEYYNDSDSTQLSRFQEIQRSMINLAKKFYSQYLPVKEQTISIESTNSPLIDIVSTNGDHELGSYGIRTYNDIIWIFGTGCAEPRLSNVINDSKKPGYHLNQIPKSNELGSIYKIIEEYEEFIDASLQDIHIMGLVELSDLYGAIESYINKHYNLKMEDLKKMSDTTKRAFINGRRS